MPLRTDVEGYAKDLWSFFFVPGRVADENTFDTYWVCRMDETALLTIRKPSNILSRSGKCWVGTIALHAKEERTEHVHIACVLPKSFLTSVSLSNGSSFKFELKRGDTSGTSFDCAKNSRITSLVCVLWLGLGLKHCMQTTKPNKKTNALPLLIGHTTLTKNTVYTLCCSLLALYILISSQQ
jgi:hypothetical protein